MDHYNDVLNTVADYRRQRAALMLLDEARREIGATLDAGRRDSTPSLARLLRVSGDLDMSAAPVEVAQSNALATAYNRQPRMQNSFFLPTGLTRDLVVGTSSSGGYLVSSANELQIGVPGGSNSLLSRCTVVRPAANTGAQRIGKFSALPTVSILASESTSISEVSPTVTQSLMVPTHGSVYVEQSRQLVLQSEGGAQALVNLATNALRTAAGVQVLDGAGSSGEVTGLTNDSAVTKAAGTSIAWAGIATALEHVEKSAGDGELAWAVTAPAATILRQRAQISGGEAILRDNRIAGYPVVVLGGTTAAHAVFGRWSDYLIYEWSPLEIAVNPFAGFQSAIIGVRGWLAFSGAPIVASSFYVIEDLT